MDARRSPPGQPGFEPAARPLALGCLALCPGSCGFSAGYPESGVGIRERLSVPPTGRTADSRLKSPSAGESALPEGCRWLCLLGFSSEPGGRPAGSSLGSPQIGQVPTVVPAA